MTSLSKHFKSRHISRLNNLAEFVVIDKHSLLLGVNFLHQHILNLLWSDLACALYSSVPLLALDVSINGLLKESNRFVNISGSLELLDLDKSLSDDRHDFLNSVLSVVHRQVEAVVVDFLQVVWVVEVHFSDFQITVNRLLVVSGLFPHFSRVQDFVTSLVLSGWSSGIIFIDLVHEMRSVLVGDSEGFTVHSSVLIHVNSFIRFLGIDVSLLGLSVVSSLEVELGLVKEDLCNTFWVVLSGNLEGRVPILFVLVHVNGFLWLVSLDEFIFSLLESLLIF